MRRLRFALEWLDMDAADLVKVQGALGDACDFSIALNELGQLRDGKHIHRYRAKLARDLHRAKREARDAFRHARLHLEDLTRSVGPPTD